MLDYLENKVKKFGKSKENVLMMLREIVKEKGYLTPQIIKTVSKLTGIPRTDLFGACSFYSFMFLEKVGKYVIKVCSSITCAMNDNYQKCIDKLKELLDIDFGQTTKDELFTLIKVNCIGWCDRAPAMLINDEPYLDLTPKKIEDIIFSIKNKELG